MRPLKYLTQQLVLISLISILTGCDPWFAYSPYEANVDDLYHGSTERNLGLINALNTEDGRPFKVALLSDPHYHYSKLAEAIAHINSQGDYAFAIVSGDLTENGLKQEFVYFHETMSRLKIPYITVIGNHDYLSNGEIVYRQMFGNYNYSFVFNNVKFVLFDNNTLESEKDPDLDWLASELVNDSGYDHVIPVAHIPPYDQQMARHHLQFHELLIRNNIRLSLHGHRHEYSRLAVYGDSVDYVSVSSPQKRTYAELSLSPTHVDVKMVAF